MAQPKDQVAIDALRAAYFARRGESIQERPDVLWRVFLEDGRITGAYSFADAMEYGQRWVLDFYAEPTPQGRRACAAMWKDIREAQRENGLAVAATVAPDNEAQIDAMEHRKFRRVGVIMLLDSEDPCQPQ